MIIAVILPNLYTYLYHYATFPEMQLRSLCSHTVHKNPCICYLKGNRKEGANECTFHELVEVYHIQIVT